MTRTETLRAIGTVTAVASFTLAFFGWPYIPVIMGLVK